MTEDSDLTQERDRALIRAFAMVAHNLRSHYREWIQDEVKDLAARADFLEAAIDGGPVKNELQITIKRIKDVDRDELRQSVQNLQEKIDEIENHGYDGIFDAKDFLTEGLTRLETLIRELLAIRKSLDELLDAHTKLKE